MQDKDLLKPSEVAALFRVDPKTVTRWAADKKIGSLKTPGGHRRFHVKEVEALLLSSFTPAMVAGKMAELHMMVKDRDQK